jgi:Uma2 family endonuclease
MAIVTRTSETAYRHQALADPDRKWELHDGILREKPPMTAAHNWLAERLGYLLLSQLDWTMFQVRTDKGRVRRPGATYFVPDVFVVPTAAVKPLLEQPTVLEVYDQPLPLVVEIWSPSTGDYDVDAKVPVYQQRGDREIWRIHPYERTLIAWQRQSDGSYLETVYREGIVRPASLPGVAIDLSALFDD